MAEADDAIGGVCLTCVGGVLCCEACEKPLAHWTAPDCTRPAPHCTGRRWTDLNFSTCKSFRLSCLICQGPQLTTVIAFGQRLQAGKLTDRRQASQHTPALLLQSLQSLQRLQCSCSSTRRTMHRSLQEGGPRTALVRYQDRRHPREPSPPTAHPPRLPPRRPSHSHSRRNETVPPA